MCMEAEDSTETLVAGTTLGPLTAFTVLDGAGAGAAALAGAGATVLAGAEASVGAMALVGGTPTGAAFGEDFITLGIVPTTVALLASVTHIAETAMRPITTAEEAIQIIAQVVHVIQTIALASQVEVIILEEKSAEDQTLELGLLIDIAT